MAGPARVVGLGGSLRAASTSRTALQAALEGAAGAGADTRLISVRDLDLPLCTAERDPPYLSNKPIGLVTTAGGIQGLQAINSMDFIARALRGWSVPLVQAVPQAWRSFDPDGQLTDEAVAAQLGALGAEVVRAAHQFRAEGTCDYADDRQFAARWRHARARGRPTSPVTKRANQVLARCALPAGVAPA